MNVEYWLIYWPVYFLVKLQLGKHNFPSIYYTTEAIEQVYIPEISVIQFSNLYYDDSVVNKKQSIRLAFTTRNLSSSGFTRVFYMKDEER